MRPSKSNPISSRMHAIFSNAKKEEVVRMQKVRRIGGLIASRLYRIRRAFAFRARSRVSRSRIIIIRHEKCRSVYDTSSPPRSIPNPLLRLLRVMVGLLEVGGTSLSKSSRRRADAPGVLPAMGVRFCHAPCAGLGVTLIKSLKLKVVLGVLGPPKPKKPLPVVPGVMWDDGRGVDLQGGVEGGC